MPSHLMGVGNEHLDGGKQVLKGDVLVSLDKNGVVTAHCRDASSYIDNVGPRCTLELLFLSGYGIQGSINAPCFTFTEFQDVSAPPHSGDATRITGPAHPHSGSE